MFLKNEAIQQIENDQQYADGCKPQREELQFPKERNAVEKSKEKRRIAQRGKRTADITHDKNKEDRKVGVMFPVSVGSEKRADQGHAGAGRSDEIREHCADGEK